ncbi:MAG TPA: fumarylacetoacetate hydrolase family protein [Gaiellaceae bacterium]|nr:fumarylacetoacetate hydrolase family protein [Gaiellaceae bacterium]
MATARYVRLRLPVLGSRVGRVGDEDVVDVLDHDDPLAALAGVGEVALRVPLAEAELLPPVMAPEIWCAGVTYERSREARVEEARSEARTVYELVYDAERPELFLKDAAMRRTVGPGGTIRVRGDADWSVPEPELGIVLDGDGRAVAVTIGNDVSSRDIEGENPLYLPQAKVYAGACAIGPALAVPDDWDTPFALRMRIADGSGETLFAGETSTASMRRSLADLAAWVVRDNPLPAGSVLLTGTGLVPEDGYTLLPGHRVEIEIDGIGTLVNTVGA